MSFFVYRMAWMVALPSVVARLAWRALRDRRYRAQVGERFAFNPPRGPFDFWIHAVSVGETRAAQPLLQRIFAANPNARVLLTHMTPTGREAGRDAFGNRLTQRFLPYDVAIFMRRFFAHAQPRCVCVMETEVWPELVAHAHARGVPLFLVNARLSEKSSRGYARVGALSRSTFTKFSAVFAQSDDDAARFSALGARDVRVLGNMKFDCAPPEDIAVRAAALRPHLGSPGALWVAGSTREGDEALLLDALHAHPLRKAARAVVVPRHPQRFEEVAALARARGFSVALRSAASHDDTAEIIIGDSMGEMFAYYACAQAVMMGGSFTTGSQNLIEPCAVGAPVVLGPSVFNFEAAAQAALACGAAQQVQTAAAALDVVQRILTEPSLHAAMSAAAQQFSQHNHGATDKTFQTINDLLGQP